MFIGTALWKFFDLITLFLLVTYPRVCKWNSFSVEVSIWVSIEGSIFEMNTFALKPKFGPKGPSDTTTEERAAHHFLKKIM